MLLLKNSFVSIFLFISIVINTNVVGKDSKINIVMLGDSTTLSSRSPAGSKLTDCVQKYFNIAFKKSVKGFVLNSGKGGDTVKRALSRLEKDVFDKKPTVITISFGLNDTGKPPEEFLKSLEELIVVIKKKSKAKILLITSSPFDNKRHVWKSKFKEGLDEYMNKNICQHMRNLAKKYHLPICDLHNIFLKEFKLNKKLISKVIRSDGVHLTEAGNDLAAKQIVRSLYKVLTRKKIKMKFK
ncbi:MAG: hypothetical protein COA79_15670 [Planctomycetota bacterium]|nr:MAG: hypothetical protein COA79_15670 [Planctomycetota bacterium]